MLNPLGGGDQAEGAPTLPIYTDAKEAAAITRRALLSVGIA